MAEFRLSERAVCDLIKIYDYAEETFAAYQAEAYHAGLERTFDLLANCPRKQGNQAPCGGDRIGSSLVPLSSSYFHFGHQYRLEPRRA